MMFYPYAGKELNTGAKVFNIIGSLLGALAGVYVGYRLATMLIAGFVLNDQITNIVKAITCDFNSLLCGLLTIIASGIVTIVIAFVVWFIGKLIWGKK